jgi:hypothetical protein
MIVPPAGVRVLVATRPVDFRKGMGAPGDRQEVGGASPLR